MKTREVTIQSNRDLGPAKTDFSLLAGISTWERLFGRQPLSWGELEDLGLKLSPAEVVTHVEEGLGDPDKDALCKALLSEHPELKAFLIHTGELAPRKQRTGTEHHFIAKLTPEGGPPPREELDHICAQAKESLEGLAWFATRMPGKQWRRLNGNGGSSVCVIFYSMKGGGLDAVVAEVRDRRASMPNDSRVQKLYRDHDGFKAWWQLARPQRARFASLESIPGQSRTDRPAIETFTGMSTFAYWRFPNHTSTVTGLLPPPSKKG